MATALTQPATTPRVVVLPERSAAVVRIEGPVAELPRLIGEAFGLTEAAIRRSAATISGPPFTRYHSFSPARITGEAGFPFEGVLEAEDRVHVTLLPGGRVVTATHVGPYDEIAGAWERGQAWIGEQGLTITGPAWECYLTDPSEPGPPVTEICWPVR
jgi:effector-binding domain-containing protein